MRTTDLHYIPGAASPPIRFRGDNNNIYVYYILLLLLKKKLYNNNYVVYKNT